ncbi:hypothetical protein Ato02nite_084430 [Paractinoplanes toevensis]|uniref:Uncharacterized protein n=2 Tax=Paractinoplanes toevensis TaxID=571911 RepID=A0A919WAK9_9ACTN|nr:hypothetical protein Ato02nite_084430 [Actinoplanes toevensis]
MLGLFKPVIEINGQRAGNAWGRQVIPLQPGQYHLHVHVPYLWPLGPADLPVNVYPGQSVELEYRAPMIAFIKGALGAPPQKWPGLVATIILFAIVGVLFLCVCGGIIVGILSDAGDSSSSYTIQAVTNLLR